MVKPVAERNLDDIASFTRSGSAGDVIFKEGDKGADLFIVQDGRVDLLREPAGVPVGTVVSGEMFGEWSFFEQKTRDVTARAATDYRLISLDRASFERITKEAPEIAIWMLQKLARALHARLPSASPPAVPAAAPAPAAAAAAPAARPAAVEKPKEAPRRPAGDALLVEEASGTQFKLAGAESIVGRIDRATGFRPEVDLTPLDTERTLSRRHARIVKRDQAYYVREDTASRNGTFVNSQRIVAATDVELHDGDEVRFGLVKTIFRWR